MRRAATRPALAARSRRAGPRDLGEHRPPLRGHRPELRPASGEQRRPASGDGGGEAEAGPLGEPSGDAVRPFRSDRSGGRGFEGAHRASVVDLADPPSRGKGDAVAVHGLARSRPAVDRPLAHRHRSGCAQRSGPTIAAAAVRPTLGPAERHGDPALGDERGAVEPGRFDPERAGAGRRPTRVRHLSHRCEAPTPPAADRAGHDRAARLGNVGSSSSPRGTDEGRPTRPRPSRAKRPWAGLLLLLAAACAREPPATVEPGSDPAEARRQLAAAASAGPVPLVVLRLEDRPSGAEAAALAARGVHGLSVRFVPTPPGSVGRRLVLALDGLEDPARICAGAVRPEPAAAGRALLAAWCDGDRPIARVRLEGAVDRVERERAIWRVVDRLFPDDYADTYGWNLFGLRVTVGGSFGF